MSISGTLTDSSGEVVRASVRKGGGILLTMRHSYTNNGAGVPRIERSRDGTNGWEVVELDTIDTTAVEINDSAYIQWGVSENFVYRIYFEVTTLDVGDGTVCTGVISVANPAEDGIDFARVESDEMATPASGDQVQFNNIVEMSGGNIIFDTLTASNSGEAGVVQKGMFFLNSGVYLVSVNPITAVFSSGTGVILLALKDQLNELFGAFGLSSPGFVTAAGQATMVDLTTIIRVKKPHIGFRCPVFLSSGVTTLGQGGNNPEVSICKIR